MTLKDTDSFGEEGAKRLMELAPYAEIVRHRPGSITLKVRLSGLNTLLEARLDRLVPHIPGIQKAKVKIFSRSVTIAYDPERIPPDLWEAVMGDSQTPAEKREIQERLRSVFEDGTA